MSREKKTDEDFLRLNEPPLCTNQNASCIYMCIRMCNNNIYDETCARTSIAFRFFHRVSRNSHLPARNDDGNRVPTCTVRFTCRCQTAERFFFIKQNLEEARKPFATTTLFSHTGKERAPTVFRVLKRFFPLEKLRRGKRLSVVYFFYFHKYTRL